ncbi:PLP-dependent aminotransferase family protein [Cognatishimia sp. SS12]|uniref:MocR-like pyridoxine biosynthesis transcription factor PdxR n=1 Tax=Cognatishimia sp. SS12 TaxID=2979465 RepID=UPI00232E0711|nr:PLP-dependent aminotransferase family protein [Cognatishimia sp. SS12]MDC0737810.1 PLP-dependent aminotransferase family protein [Cognatishimia sp. SS12]
MTRPVTPHLRLDRAAATPLFEQLASGLRQQVTQGDLPAGTRLPPTRSYAVDLGVSRATVMTAYDQLVAEGYLMAQRGAGYQVADLGGAAPPTGSPTAKPLGAAPVRPSAVFTPGQPDMALFPHRAWAKTVARLCRQNPDALLADTAAFGHDGLRRTIAQHVADWRGFAPDPEQVIVTAGAADALEMTLRVLCAGGETVAIEDPGYRPLRRFIDAQGLQTEYLSLDGQGALLPTRAAATVLTPSHQFPLGGAMTPQRRLQFLHWANETKAWVVEDDYDSEFRYSGHPIPAMAGMDGLRRTIYIGSFSKIFSNTLRIGYVIVPHALRARYAEVIARFGRRASVMPQAPLAAFMQTGEFYRHLRRMRRIYGQRRAAVIDQLRTDFSDVLSFQDAEAGMQLALHLHDGFADHDIAARAGDHGLAVEPLSAYCLGPACYNGLLLGFCGQDEEAARQGLATLARIIKQT